MDISSAVCCVVRCVVGCDEIEKQSHAPHHLRRGRRRGGVVVCCHVWPQRPPIRHGVDLLHLT